ncbi:class I SAM-dependent methyltransferase [Treponema sp. R80B11-R83G3]
MITLWYVIEHFTDCLTVLAEIKKLLKPGGILAFSTPSYSGVSGRKSLRKFLENSPADHFTIWAPKMCKKALVLAGFKVKKIVITGFHPERFPLFGKFAKSKKSPLYWIFWAVSKIFGLGDTFEVYAQKKSKKKNSTTNHTNQHEQQQAFGQQHLNTRSRLTSIHVSLAYSSSFALYSCGSW